jgi:hypothetical protein
MLAGLAMFILLLLPRHRLGNPAMIRAEMVASSHEGDGGGHDGRDVNALHDTHQKFSPYYAAGQKQPARDEPDRPGQDADSPRASFNEQAVYLECDEFEAVWGSENIVSLSTPFLIHPCSRSMTLSRYFARRSLPSEGRTFSFAEV